MTGLPAKAFIPPWYMALQAAAMAIAVWVASTHMYQDDAYISLRYAKNLIEGNGLTWNPGERVEGYTNFLFIIFTASLGKLGIELALASRIVSFAAYGGIVATMAWYTRAAQQPGYAQSVNRGLALLLVASSVPLLAWCLGGLEPNLFAFFITLALCLTLRLLQNALRLRGAFLIGICFALAAMTRLDALVFFAATGMFLTGCWLTKRISFTPLVAILAGFLLLAVPYMAWRVSYFGEWLPNTYYAKSFGLPHGLLWHAGLQYVCLYVLFPPLMLPLGLAVAGLAARARKADASMLYCGFISCCFLLYVASVGGDFMPYFRFIVPAVPALALLLFHGLSWLAEDKPKRFRDVCGALVFFSVFQWGMVSMDSGDSMGALSGISVQQYVNTHWPKGSLIALNPAGALPYLAPDYRYIDMLGLLDKPIARRTVDVSQAQNMPIGHMKGDGAYVLSRHPDYIIFGSSWWADDRPRFLSDREISELPQFKTDYRRVEALVTPPPELLPALQFFASRATPEWQEPLRRGQARFVYYQCVHNCTK